MVLAYVLEEISNFDPLMKPFRLLRSFTFFAQPLSPQPLHLGTGQLYGCFYASLGLDNPRSLSDSAQFPAPGLISADPQRPSRWSSALLAAARTTRSPAAHRRFLARGAYNPGARRRESGPLSALAKLCQDGSLEMKGFKAIPSALRTCLCWPWALRPSMHLRCFGALCTWSSPRRPMALATSAQ